MLKKIDELSSDIFEHYEKKIYDQKQLIEISKALNSTLDYNALIDSILNTCLAQMHTLNAAVYLAPDVDAPYFTIDSSFKGFDFSEKEIKTQILIDSPFIQYFEEKPKAIALKALEKIGNMQNDEYFKMFKAQGVEVISPLSAKGKVSGVLILGEKMNTDVYAEEEKDFLTNLTSLAAIAVQNARLYELATVDMMTQLKVHHYFQSKLREEMEKCRKKGTKLSLLFTDVDKFKVFNDTYGHQAGDAVLIEVARKVMECCRKNDIAARYGGEEFVAILPSTNEVGGYQAALRMQATLNLLAIPHQRSPIIPQVTMSFGLAVMVPHADQSPLELIEIADQYLYQAKRTGKNRIVSSGIV
jgi:diguanylate cyclase (GGDEF)-like protein